VAFGGRGPLGIEDARGGDATLRVTWHADQRKVVLSHWHGGRCTASTAVNIGEVPRLISALVDALGQAAGTPSRKDEGTRSPSEAFRELWRSVVRRVRRDVAAVVPIAGPRPLSQGPDLVDRERPGIA
jgi:hypothetical protein